MHRFWNGRVLVGVIGAVGVLCTGFDLGNVEAQTMNFWTNSAGGLWQTAANNWSEGRIPTNTDLVFLTNASPTKTITINSATPASSRTISNLTISTPFGSNNVLSLTDPGTNIPLRTLNLFRITAGGSLVISNGAVEVGFATMATPFRDDGQVLLNAPTSRLISTNGSPMSIGNTGQGLLTVSNGLLLAEDEIVGDLGGSSGTLTMAGGTNLMVGGGVLSVGDGTGATGTVWVTGGHLEVVATTITSELGRFGVGRMTVSNGTVLLPRMAVGNLGQGTLTVAGGTNTFSTRLDIAGTGFVWLTGGQLLTSNTFVTTVIAVSGTGQMTVSNGTWQAYDVLMGSNPGSQGTLTIAGGTNVLSSFLSVGEGTNATGVVWLTDIGRLVVTNATTFIGARGAGQITISNGVFLARSVLVGTNTTATGTLTVAGGTNRLSGDLALGLSGTATGVVTMTGGLLTATNSASQTILVGSNGVGRLTVGNAILLGRQLNIASGPSSSGSVTINSGGTLACVGPVVIGSATGSGVLTVSDGQFTITNTPATVTGVSTGLYVDGSLTESNGTINVPSSPVSIGNRGVGSLTVYHGSNVFNSLELGNFPGSTGTLTMYGGTNTISFGTRLGNGAAATGTIWFNGDRLNTDTADIGWSGVGIMTMSGGVWRTTGQVNVGQINHGTLTVAGGTMILDATALVVPRGSTVNGTVWLTGGQLIATNSLIHLGEVGSGILTVSNALLTVRDLYMATNSLLGGVGTFTVAAGTNNVYRSLIMGTDNCTGIGAVNVSGGRLFVTNSTASAVLDVRSGTLTLNSGTLVIDHLVITNACGHFVRTGGTLIMTSPPTLGAGLDADGDGLPNDWEVANGLDPLDPNGVNGANGDPDGDGQNNLQEFQAGTVPTVDIKSIVREGNDIRVTWQAIGSKTNALERQADVPGFVYNPSTFFVSVMFVLDSGGLLTNAVDVGAATFPGRYYRVRLRP